jgi:hypothetical protein
MKAESTQEQKTKKKKTISNHPRTSGTSTFCWDDDVNSEKKYTYRAHG